ncbi:hypothetical protein ACQJBY_001944 [Aegilops geniculata]
MAAAAERVSPVAALYAVDIDEVQDFNVMYQLHVRPCTVMFFYGNLCVDVRGPHSRDNIIWPAYGGPHSRDDIIWPAYGGDDFAGLVRAVHERARAGRRLVVLG